MLTWQIFQRYLFSSRAEALVRRIAWLSVIGVAIGVGAFILVQSVMNRFNSSIHERLLASEPHIVAYIEGSEAKDREQQLNEIYLEIGAINGIRIHRFEAQDVVLRTTDGHFSGAVARGVDPESLSQVIDNVSRIQKESFRGYIPDRFREGTSSLDSNEVLLGSHLAVSLGAFEGDRLVVIPPESLLLPPDQVPTYDRVRVARNMDLNSADLNTRGLFYIRGRALERLSQSAGIRLGVEIWTDSMALQNRVVSLLKDRPGVQVETWQDRNAALFFALNLERFIMGVFLGLSALIAGFSILIVMALLLSQKSNEIGIFMAMGMSRKDIHALFVRLGVLLSSFGILAGVVWGAGLSFYLKNYPLALLPDIYYDSRVSAEPRLDLILLTVFGALLLALIGSRLPVRELKTLSPVQVLRQGKQKA